MTDPQREQFKANGLPGPLQALALSIQGRIEALVDQQPFADIGSTAVERVIFEGLSELQSALLIAQAAHVEQLQHENARMSEWCDQASAAMTAHSIEETNQRIRAEAAEALLAAQVAQLETVRQELAEVHEYCEGIEDERARLRARVASLEAGAVTFGSRTVPSNHQPEPGTSSPSLPSGPDRSSFRAGYAFGFADRHDGQSSNPEYAWKRMFAIVTRGGTRTVGPLEAPRPVCTCRHDSGMSTDCVVHFPAQGTGEPPA